jgi:DNA-binding SARP family transcriptional activator
VFYCGGRGSPVDFVILGRTALIKDGIAVRLGAAKERGTLSLLLLYANKPVKIETLVECLWHDRSRSDRRQIIYSLISRLRAVFAQLDMPEALELVRPANAYRLHVNPLVVDIHLFRSLVLGARAQIQDRRYTKAVTTLREALGLWRGEPIPDVRGARSSALRSQLDDEFLTAQKLLVEALLHAGRPEAALGHLENIVHDHDLDETLARLWITALHAVGRSDEARRYFAAFRPRFRRSFRAEPDIDLVAIMTRSTTTSVRECRPHQLPNGIKDFIGRTDALQELDSLAEPAGSPGNVVVITGTPGVGKTALALHWAQQRLDRFPDGQLQLDMGTYSSLTPVDPHAALARFLDALDVPATAIPPETDQRRTLFNRLLDGRRMLVILDDVENSAQAQPLIPAAPGCLTLITSRHRLGRLTVKFTAPTVTVEPLTTEDSVTLLVRLIGSLRADREPEALIRLAHAADGLPVALRIIGEHVTERPRAAITDLADELCHHLLDPVGDHDQVSLNSIFSWSYRALSPDVAALFRQLAQHPGPSISVEVAAAMAGAEPDVTETRLNTLAKAHLIGHDTARHYRFLDLLRSYAGKCASTEDDPTKVTATLVRALTWYLVSAVNASAVLFPESPPVHDLPKLGEQPAMHFAGAVDARRWCERERDNLAAATRGAARHGFHRLAWQIHGATYQIFLRSGRLDGLLELSEIAVVAARLDEHPAAEIGHLLNVGGVHLTERRYRQAQDAATAALHLALDTGQREYEAICSHSLATTLLETGMTEEAVRLYARTLELCRQASDGAGEAATLHRLGDVHRRRGALDLATTFYLQALEMLQRIGSIGGQGRTHSRLADLFLEKGEMASAAHHCERALATCALTGEGKVRCEALTIRADVRRRSAAPAEAVVDARQAVATATEINDSLGLAGALAALADALAELGSPAEAAAASSQGLSILETIGGPDISLLQRRLLISYARSMSAEPV